jgi:hypothetical protein
MIDMKKRALWYARHQALPVVSVETVRSTFGELQIELANGDRKVGRAS